jgi:hypothetical protein
MEERIYQGYVYRRAGPGQPWTRAEPVAQQAPQPNAGRVIADPYRAAEEGRKQQDQAFEAERLRIQQESARLAREEAERRNAVAPFEAQRAQAEAVKADAQARAAVNEQNSAPDPQLGRIRTELQTDSVLDAVRVARRQIGEGWSTGNVFGSRFFQGIPVAGQNSTNLNATLEGLTGSIINDTLAQLKALSATGASGFGSLTEREAQRLAAATAALQQDQDAENLTRNLARVEKHYRNALALLNGEDPRLPEVAEKYGIVSLVDQEDQRDEAVPGAMGGPGMELTSEGSYEPDPGLSGVNSRVAEMIQRGRGEDEIRAYLNRVRPGMGDAATGIGEAIQFNRQFPDRPPQIDLESTWVPASGLSRALGDIGMSPIGAGFIGAADTLSFGTLDNMMSNPEMARAVMTGVSEENPWSYFGGQVAGGFVPGIGIEAGLARLGAGRLAQARAGDAVFGGLYGAGSTDDPESSRVAGALIGTGGGLLGGALGRQTARVGGRALTGVQDAAARTLDRAGVRMTPGQILGGGLKNAEDKMTSLPLVGNQIGARRAEGIEDFNRAAFDQALAPIGRSTDGVIAEPGIDIARELRSEAYSNALDPVSVLADEPFEIDMAAVSARANDLPEPLRGTMNYTLPTYVGQRIADDGTMTGRGVQEAFQGLRREARATERMPGGYGFGEVARQAEDSIAALLARQSPETMPALNTANEVNRNVETLRTAVNAGRNQGGMFMPSQLSTAASQNARRYGNSQGTTNQPFFDLTRAGQEVLPNRVPDSGTAGRIFLPAAAGAVAGGGSYAQGEDDPNRGSSSAANAAIIAALAAAPYSAPARATIQRALLAERPEQMVRIGEGLYSRDLIAGLLSRPMGAVAMGGQ